MNDNNLNLNQQNNVLNGTIQGNVPQSQDDPALAINPQVRRPGDLYLTSNLSFEDQSVLTVKIEIDQIPQLFLQIFDSSEANLSTDEEIQFETSRYSPSHYTFTPNIAQYIGNVILGLEMGTKYQESIMMGCAMYLDGVAEILPNGSIRILNVRRDGTNRRYSELCMIIHYAIGSYYYKVRPNVATTVKMYQSLMQEIYGNAYYTSVLTRIKKFQSRGSLYNVSRAAIRRWALDVPWHALMYNSQAPLDKQQFIDLFFKVYSVNVGQELRYDMTHDNDQFAQTINPNSILFTSLIPENMVAAPTFLSADIPLGFITFMRYYLGVDYVDFRWRAEGEESSEDDDSDKLSDDDRLDGTPDAENMDDSVLGS